MLLSMVHLSAHTFTPFLCAARSASLLSHLEAVSSAAVAARVPMVQAGRTRTQAPKEFNPRCERLRRGKGG